MGSVTVGGKTPCNNIKFQLTRSVGSVTQYISRGDSILEISTHTLRGERDTDVIGESSVGKLNFNSHAPWGAWLWYPLPWKKSSRISTHTLRGERDGLVQYVYGQIGVFQLTRSVGSVTQILYSCGRWAEFQLTRSVGSVTKGQLLPCLDWWISTHTLRGERDQ